MRKVAAILTIIVCLSLVAPTIGEARRYYHGPYRGCCGCSGDYWVPAAVLAGTVLAGALVIGAMNQSSRQPTQPTASQPAYRQIDNRQPYASPDPDFLARYSKKEASGQWTIIPAQKVGDTWVPAHRVFVPDP